MDEKAVKQEIQKIVDKFEKINEDEKSKKYNEEQTKKNYILPLFRALGWDVESDDVKAEERVSKKRVDYAFKINSVPKFYLECKPFREDISDPKYAKQAIEYAWNKSVTWAILCNFQGMKVFNAEWKWDDKNPTRNRFLDLRYNEYTGSCFKYLTWLSRESFEQGILDKQATILGKKAKKLSIGEQLLSDFTEYRSLLSKDILKNNQKLVLSQEELDEIVQRVLDRIIFIRTCEDKEIESDKLESLVRIYGDKKELLYKELNKRYRGYDEGYNSKLFQIHICEEVVISNDVLKQVILGTYRSKNFDIRYDFSAINADVLGNIYEQYLGHILKSSSKRAKITNGKAHRKDQGIYYTPTYVVEYIVRNTIEQKLKKRNVNVDELKILDPTCGSGSFLIKAFDVLIEYTLKKESKGTTLQSRFEDINSGSTKTLKRKTELMKNCIFGVDLDLQAVEITQLNLLLKLAEKRQRLPTLRNNIKSGNSLINGGEIELEPYFGNEWKEKTPFNWNEEFNTIMNNDGFDIIIGNPPYVHQKGTPDDPTISLEDRTYYRENYKTIFKEGVKTIGGVKLNLFIPYVERCIHLLKDEGLMGFIVHKNLLKVASYKFLREYILDNCIIKIIVDLGADVFEEVTGETIIIILQKCSSKRKRDNNNIKIFYDLNKKEDLISNNYKANTIKQKDFYENADSIFSIYIDRSFSEIKNKMEKDSFKLTDVANIVSFGLNTSDNKKYFIEEKIDENYKNAVMGRDIDKWIIKNKNKFVYYHEDVLTRKGDEKAFLSDEKLILQRVGSDLKCAYDNEKTYCYNSTNMILSKNKGFSLKYILALLNSKLINTYYKTVFSTKSNLTVNVTQGYLSQLPIKSITPKKQAEIIEIVNKIIVIKNKLKEMEGKTTDKKNNLEIELNELDNKLNKEIYSIYGLSDEEILKI